MLCHDTGTSAEYDPCEQRADNGIAETDPSGSNSVFPTELTGIADKYNGGKI